MNIFIKYVRNTFWYLPAYLINQTGVRSTGMPLIALNIRGSS